MAKGAIATMAAMNGKNHRGAVLAEISEVEILGSPLLGLREGLVVVSQSSGVVASEQFVVSSLGTHALYGKFAFSLLGLFLLICLSLNRESWGFGSSIEARLQRQLGKSPAEAE